jgi:threonine/homoserine/homoserine lactone efflux protein
MNGILMAFVPVITDFPIVFLSIFFLQSLSNTDFILGLISISGGLFLIYLAFQNFRFVPDSDNSKSGYGSSLKIGIITNFLSPHPYLFWITIGAPTFIKASNSATASSFVFIIGFYLVLISSKVLIAIISGKVKGVLGSTGYKNTMKIIGALLFILSGIIIYEGLLLVWS